MAVGTDGRPPLPLFNPLDERFRADPYPSYHRYRAEDPIHWAGAPDHDGAGIWFLFRYMEVMAALRNPTLVRDPKIQPPDPLGAALTSWMLFRNPPDHTRLRSLVNKAFTRRMAERLQPAIEDTADFLLDKVQADGEMDLMLHYASPLPLITIAELLGIPSSDREQLRSWTMDLTRGIDIGPNRAVLERATQSTLELVDYLRTIVARRRRDRKDDLISALIACEEDGDKLSEDEMLSMCVLLLGAGHETTINLIGNGTLALLQHPDQWTRLRDEAACTEGAVEELLRYDCPVQMTFRQAGENCDIGGKLVRKGEVVAILLGSANRDPEQFPDPDRLDLARAAVMHGAFGMGIHFCLGSHLARLEAHIAFRTLARRMPDMTLLPRPVERRDGTTFRGLKSLFIGF
jgi:pimeloyl-[acyl-carrier protein] synthase